MFRFGVFELNDAAEELRKNGVRLKLNAQPFQVLLLLLERGDGLVTREEMRRRLWPDNTFVDFDHGLNTAVNKLRQALGDSALQPRYIETVAGKGYRFIAPVTVAGQIAEASHSPEQPAAEATPESVPHPLPDSASVTLLAAPHELPEAPRKLVLGLLLSCQLMYLAFYVSALANLPEIEDIFTESRLLSPRVLMVLLVTTATTLIPVRLFLITAVAFDYRKLAAKFEKLYAALLVLDLLWALSPFLLIHHINIGLALGMSAALVYLPFAQRSLVLMSSRRKAG